MERRLSRAGYAFLLNNGAIIFRSMMQKSQALSTAEAEYVALCAASQDAAYLIQMLQELGMGDVSPVTLLEDNQACMDIAGKDVASPKLKHIDIRYHFVRTMLLGIIYIQLRAHNLSDFETVVRVEARGNDCRYR